MKAIAQICPCKIYVIALVVMEPRTFCVHFFQERFSLARGAFLMVPNPNFLVPSAKSKAKWPILGPEGPHRCPKGLGYIRAYLNQYLVDKNTSGIVSHRFELQKCF